MKLANLRGVLPETYQEQYHQAARAQGVLLRDVQARALRDFLKARAAASADSLPTLYLRAPRDAELLDCKVDAALVDQVNRQATADQVPVRQLVYSALIHGAGVLMRARQGPKRKAAAG